MLESLSAKIVRIGRAIGRFEMALSCLFLVTLVGVVGIGVFLRYVLKSPLVAGMNFATLMLVWMSFFGASFVYREKGHIAIEFVVNRFPVSVRRFLMVTVYGIITLALAVTVVQSGYLAAVQWKQQIVALGIPRSFLSLPIGITGCLMILTTLQHMLTEIRMLPPQQDC